MMPKIAVTMTGFWRMFTIVFARSSTTDGEVGLSAAARKACRTSPITMAAGNPWPATSPIESAMRPSGKRESVVPVAADDRFFGRRNVGGIEPHAFVFGELLGQERALKLSATRCSRA